MITRLSLERFKSFLQADLTLDNFTLLVGANASGKSNLRDAFRFLSGIGQGYTLAEIIGGVYRNGVEVWPGIRGGARELSFHGQATFALEVACILPIAHRERTIIYRTEIQPGQPGDNPLVMAERLTLNDDDGPVMVERNGPPSSTFHVEHLLAACIHRSSETMATNGPELRPSAPPTPFHALFGSMRFLDVDLTAMRQPTQPGQVVLSDHGENLSSVLHHLCQDPQRKQTILSWVEALTQMSFRDLEFPADQIGRVLTTLVETNGQRFSVYSASDGTLRLLAMLAALLTPQPARFSFFEELENGIHPTQLHLVLDLLERIAHNEGIQIVATTHSPQSLRFLTPKGLAHTTLAYRLEDQPDTRLHRLLDLPYAREVIAQQDIANLHESRWFEDSAACLEELEEDA